MKPQVLDLYCSAGGVGLALDKLGIPHVGVDIEDKSDKYTGEFVQADASDKHGLQKALAENGYPTTYELVWASPPCLAYTPLSHVNASRYDWDETPKERYPTIPELNVHKIVTELGEDYIIENVSHCDDLENPTEINGHAFGMGIECRHKFETSFDCPRAVERGETVMQAGKTNNRDKMARLKGVPTDWTLTEINSAVPRPYVQYLLHYAGMGVRLPSMPQSKLF